MTFKELMNKFGDTVYIEYRHAYTKASLHLNNIDDNDRVCISLYSKGMSADANSLVSFDLYKDKSRIRYHDEYLSYQQFWDSYGIVIKAIIDKSTEIQILKNYYYDKTVTSNTTKLLREIRIKNML
jgi:hypothetical protein